MRLANTSQQGTLSVEEVPSGLNQSQARCLLCSLCSLAPQCSKAFLAGGCDRGLHAQNFPVACLVWPCWRCAVEGRSLPDRSAGAGCWGTLAPAASLRGY